MKRSFAWIATGVLGLASIGGTWVFGANPGVAAANQQPGTLAPCPAPSPGATQTPGIAGGTTMNMPGMQTTGASPSPSSSPGTALMCITIPIPPGAMGQGPAAYGVNPQVIPPNTTVTWVNNDSEAHTVTADNGSFDSGTLNPGQSFSQTFTEPGTIAYHCTIHGAASMSGTLQVQAAGTASPGPSPSPSASPSAAAGTAGGGGVSGGGSGY